MLIKEVLLLFLSCLLQDLFVECRPRYRDTPKFTEKDLKFPYEGSQLDQQQIRNMLVHMRDSGVKFKRLTRKAAAAKAVSFAPPPVPGVKYQLSIARSGRVPTSRIVSKIKQTKNLLRQQNSVQHAPPKVARQDDSESEEGPSLDQMLEAELAKIINSQTALKDDVYIERKGINDFLVIGKASDKFIDYVPNNIYYGVQMKCVNWLSNCNQKGLEKLLLHKITGPYPYSLPN